jgi:hypothetical protein
MCPRAWVYTTDEVVEHHEVASHTSDSVRSPPNVKSPPLPTRPQRLSVSPGPAPTSPKVFADKNPFRNSDTTTAATKHASTNPFLQPYAHELAQPDQDEDEDLQRALAMSVDTEAEGELPGYVDDRPDRERSIRATAPPPSPTEKRGEIMDQANEPSRTQSPFGPREEGATGNSLAMVPHTMNDVSPASSSHQIYKADSRRELRLGRKRKRIWRRLLPTR